MTGEQLINKIKECGINKSIYIRYEGCDIEIEEGDSFKIHDIEEDYGMIDIIIK